MIKKYSASNPKYSVVIPAYNESEFIKDTLLSLQQQSYKGDIEIIVVDNNSSDSTAKIASDAGAIVYSESNIGVCWARQMGTLAAKGEIIISSDADTTYDKDWILNIDKAFRSDKELVALAGGCQFKEAPLWAKIYPALLFGAIDKIYKLTGRTVYGSATNIAFKKTAWNGYDTTLSQGGDELGLLRNLKQSGKVKFINSNPTYTSSRRLYRGFIYNVLFSFLIYYILEYNLSRIFNRPVFGPCPKFRDNSTNIPYWFNRPAILKTANLLTKSND